MLVGNAEPQTLFYGIHFTAVNMCYLFLLNVEKGITKLQFTVPIPLSCWKQSSPPFLLTFLSNAQNIDLFGNIELTLTFYFNFG